MAISTLTDPRATKAAHTDELVQLQPWATHRPVSLPSAGEARRRMELVNTATSDVYLAAGSPARGAADPATDLTGIAAQDIDGDLRASSAELGADEIQ